MASLAGALLLASPHLLDPNFFRSVVLILEHDEAGALGVILNRPSTSGVDEAMPEWAPLLAEPSVVFIGGPVQPEAAVGLARGLDGSSVAGIGVVDLSASPGEMAVPVRIYSGYAGWGAGQLETELEDGGWIIAGAQVDDVFAAKPGLLWAEVLKRQPGPTALLASFPLAPGLN